LKKELYWKTIAFRIYRFLNTLANCSNATEPTKESAWYAGPTSSSGHGALWIAIIFLDILMCGAGLHGGAYGKNMTLWPEIKSGGWLNDHFNNKSQVEYWRKIFDSVYEGKIDTWDYQLSLTFITNHYMSVIPNVNLISNLGYCGEATHTAGGGGVLSEMKTLPMNFPMIHPDFMIKDALADKKVETLFFKSHGTFELIKHNIKVSIKKMLKIKK